MCKPLSMLGLKKFGLVKPWIKNNFCPFWPFSTTVYHFWLLLTIFYIFDRFCHFWPSLTSFNIFVFTIFDSFCHFWQYLKSFDHFCQILPRPEIENNLGPLFSTFQSCHNLSKVATRCQKFPQVAKLLGTSPQNIVWRHIVMQLSCHFQNLNI